MLSSMHNDLIGEFEEHASVHAMWDARKLKYGGTSTARLYGLNIMFDSYKMRSNHTMKQHFRMLSTMICELKVADNNLTE